MKDVFLLAKDPENDCREIIYHRGSSLRMRVYCLNEQDFQQDPDELQFFANNNGQLLAFETWKYEMDDPGLIIEAIRWYARYIGNSKMEILADDPREEQRNSSPGSVL